MVTLVGAELLRDDRRVVVVPHRLGDWESLELGGL